MDEKPKDLWKEYSPAYQFHVTISTIDSTINSENIDERVVYIEDLEKRKQAYGICGECKEPGTGQYWCRPCNAKRFKDNFKNWTSGNKDIDELIQHSQLNAVHFEKCFEWIPFEKFQNVTYIAKGGFDPNNKEYMMVLDYCDKGNLRNYLNESKNYINYEFKVDKLQQIANGLLNIHNAEKVHKDFHSGNILFDTLDSYISDLGMCQPANIKKTVKEEGIYGVLPYMAPEVLRGYQYTKASDIYSFGIIMNEFLSEEIPFDDIPHNEFLAIKICKGLRPTISKDIPKLLADLIIKCWDAEIGNRPTTKELYQILSKLNKEIYDKNSELYYQTQESDEIRRKKFKNSKSNDDRSENIQTHSQAIYTSRLLNFKNFPKPVNSSDLSSFQFSSDATQSTSANPTVSECLDVQLSELELNEICQDSENNIE
ncbi:uncharacterized protein OCT59_020116 [Rhizophagus irregularis]|uniref:uncharacterized protein n=1 Tax=Rhizophagus irregularis TaxID=588596 RepID=UPI003334610E|nr:hypothetical protein OCT59_020116 [Rhizophagus irregularis]